MSKRLPVPITAMLLLCLASQLIAQTPLGTEFTYQGQLKGAGAVTNADIRFSLFNAETAGSQIGSTLAKDNIGVEGGLFTTSLDFGSSAFNGEARWLEVQVRSPAGAGSFTTLNPRQPVSGTPYALQTRGLFVDSTGQVGVGTTGPVDKLDVRGGAMSVQNLGDQADLLWLNSERSWVFRQQDTGAETALKLQSVGGGGNKNFLIDTTGAVGIGDSANSERAWLGYGFAGSPHFSVVNARPGGNIVLTPGSGGVVQVRVLEVTGADVAEKFPASEKLDPGMVVAIDPKNPGKLCLARSAYNRCVAGVVSGANNFPVGAVLGSAMESKDAPAIALGGRVYVICDASSGAIEPGDLLTTSDVPGHAMKVTDIPRAQGAIIGKAMTPLARGERGMVLVLVNLQ